MVRYRVSESVHLETHHATHGPIDLSFETGEVTPRSEQEEEALKHLASVGFAETLAEPERAAPAPKPPPAREVSDAPE